MQRNDNQTMLHPAVMMISAPSATAAMLYNAADRENIYMKCRLCLIDIPVATHGITVFSKDFLDEKIRKYLFVDIDFSDCYPKRLCRECLIKLEDIHQYATQSQKNQAVFARYAEIVKPNAVAQSQPLKMHKTTLLSNNDITIFAYDDLKLGQIIKDYGLLTLILKALKWDSSPQRLHEQLERLKNSNFQDVLCNPVLLQDEDMMQLLGPYTNREPSLSITRHMTNNNSNDGLRLIDNDDTNVTEMEVGVDPELFFPFEDDETRSAEEVVTTSVRDDVKPVLCMVCPQAQIFNNEAELIEHNKLKHDTSVRLVEKKNPTETYVMTERRTRTTRKSEKLFNKDVESIRLKPIEPIVAAVVEPAQPQEPPQLITALVVATLPTDTIIPATVQATIVEPNAVIAPNKTPVAGTESEPTTNTQAVCQSPEVINEVVLTTAPAQKCTPPVAAEAEPAVGPKKRRKGIDKKNTRSRRHTEKMLASSENKVQKRSTSSRFTCPQCGKKLSSKGNLKVHIDTHKPKGKFNCDKCGRIFKTYLNLVRHKKYHSGEKYSCPTCARVYPTSSTLRAHVVTHSSDRPHKCPICSKTFKRNQDLKFHINQHTGDKPYKCQFCPREFASSGNCFSHRKRMHSDKM